MAVQRKFIDKGLLKNVIRHTDAHNKVHIVLQIIIYIKSICANVSPMACVNTVEFW